MEQWEYTTAIMYANVEDKGVRDYLKGRWPAWKPPKYAPEALIPRLNDYGKDGWELISIENVYLGNNWDIAHPHGGSGNWAYSSAYLVAFKRCVEG